MWLRLLCSCRRISVLTDTTNNWCRLRMNQSGFRMHRSRLQMDGSRLRLDRFRLRIYLFWLRLDRSRWHMDLSRLHMDGSRLRTDQCVQDCEGKTSHRLILWDGRSFLELDRLTRVYHSTLITNMASLTEVMITQLVLNI